MKTDDLEAFVAVVRHQSISRAAQELGIAQPLLSRRVQGLEGTLGIALFDRQSKPVRPTPAGLRLAEQCRSVLREVDILRDLAAADLPPNGNLRLGVTQSLGELVLGPLLDQLRQEWPDLRPQVSTGWGATLVERVERGELDAAVVLQQRGRTLPGGVEARLLHRGEVSVLGRLQDWPLKRYGLADCVATGWVLNPDGCGFRAGLARALGALGLSMNVRLDTYTRDLQLDSVNGGLGLGLMPQALYEKSAFNGKLATLALRDFKPEAEAWLVVGQGQARLEGPIRRIETVVAQALA
ncbi:LysR family transcriptional regulator [Herbaspirillum sp. alder98]|uniref:LysR family transcriptional regulator n=1 Tax=Herbaspirillum sp. alder98 TaxID=2913096 RepID=UPI001CD8F195|nr:LysR family transcriptional regulator [Herbaspirillum sp. alder98]MCA1326212.1 LysR family transcriptional regulator [Herbaspirillum sp. alder98]